MQRETWHQRCCQNASLLHAPHGKLLQSPNMCDKLINASKRKLHVYHQYIYRNYFVDTIVAFMRDR